MEWWKHPDAPGYFSDFLLLEQKEMEYQFNPEKETRIDREGGWFDPFWVKSQFLKLGRTGNKLYWTLKIIFGREVAVPRRRGKKPQVQIEWEPQVWQFRIEYPEEYPTRAPKIYVQEPGLAFSTPHRLPGGALCLFSPLDGREYGWNPNTGTAATIALWATEWVRAYLNWKKTGTWPGRSAY